MKRILLLVLLLSSHSVFAQVTYVPVTIAFPQIVAGGDAGGQNYVTLVQVVNNNSSATTGHIALFGDNGSPLGVLFDGRPPVKPGDVPSINYYAVSPDYFQAMGIPLKRGRSFTNSDRKGSGRVVIVSETFASRFFPNEDAIGKRVHVTQGRQTWREIVGIVGDTKQYRLDQKSPAQVYEPLAQMPFWFMTFVVKTTGNPMALAHPIEQRIQRVDPAQPVTMIRPLQKILDQSIADSRIGVLLLSVFGSIALLMAATGLYAHVDR